MAWLGAGLLAGMSRPGTDNASPLSPLSSWRSDRAFGLVAGLVTGLVIGLVLGLVFGFRTGLGRAHVGLWDGLGFGLAWPGSWPGSLVGLVYPQSWSSSLAFAQLAASDRTPVRLMRFLEDARSRGVLRTVGPVYQFRHARLQDRLAAQEPATGQSRRAPPGGRRRCSAHSGSTARKRQVAARIPCRLPPKVTRHAAPHCASL